MLSNHNLSLKTGCGIKCIYILWWERELCCSFFLIHTCCNSTKHAKCIMMILALQPMLSLFKGWLWYFSSDSCENNISERWGWVAKKITTFKALTTKSTNFFVLFTFWIKKGCWFEKNCFCKTISIFNYWCAEPRSDAPKWLLMFLF